MVEVDLSTEVLKYLQHVDNYSDPKGALFIETTVSPVDYKLVCCILLNVVCCFELFLLYSYLCLTLVVFI
ncbi:hypothetical protein HanHA300_Chr04g0135051 [Helianthus annuus]|nr:hypothetical protein HanHA300_Chr04g0135051 [Helianthus annuus]KAJ0596868.1 hypothetical protein HanHA89_Chr04g0147941 [Helianthus annuus]KAJ0757547.1 hypothetical protein HanLR1_Chr04g0140031 [Helianthus annuus]KAJ0761229.1 hypothetical protein HanOQP8_Chr04g0147391 [Helianthus annuus]